MWGKTAEIKSSPVVSTKPAPFRNCGFHTGTAPLTAGCCSLSPTQLELKPLCEQRLLGLSTEPSFGAAPWCSESSNFNLEQPSMITTAQVHPGVMLDPDPVMSLYLGCCPTAKWERRVEKWCLILILLENTLSVHRLTIASWYRAMGWSSWDKILRLSWNMAS